MTNSRQKGKRIELRWARKLKEAGFEAWRAQQFKGSTDSADIISPLLDRLFHNEVKGREQLRLQEWVKQAQEDAGPGKLVYVAHKKSREQGLVTMPEDDFLELLQLLRGVL